MSESGLSVEVRAVCFETAKHIQEVQKILHAFCVELLRRAELHDQSKLESPEAEAFAVATSQLAGSTYGSPEYNAFLKELAPALEHHYAKNRHHAEHFKNGIDDMNIIDIVEMLADWRAATKRHNDGNIRKSIEHNANRFKICPQLVKIFENSVEFLEKA